MLRRTFVLSIALFLILPVNFLSAENFDSSTKGFSVSPSEDWMELPLPLQGVVVSYGKKGTLATFHITERDLDEDKTAPTTIDRRKAEIGSNPATVEPQKDKVRTVDQLSWKDLFSPEFNSIDISHQSMTTLAGEKAKFCVYTLKPGEFKETMEGKLPGKYINYVLIHRGKLFSITFKDTQDGFALNYPSFLAAIRTLRFDAPVPQTVRKRS